LSEFDQALNTTEVRVLIYATPVNMGLGGGIHGETILAMLRAKVAAARTTAALGGALTFEDFRDLCPPDDFLHPDYVVEHLNENGRRRLTRLITSKATELLGRG
jgi:hypothetical protein